MFKKKEFIPSLLMGLILVVAPTAVVVTYAVPYSHMGGNTERVQVTELLQAFSNQKK